MTPMMLKQANTDNASKIEWKSDDEFIATGKTGKPVTFTKSK